MLRKIVIAIVAVAVIAFVPTGASARGGFGGGGFHGGFGGGGFHRGFGGAGWRGGGWGGAWRGAGWRGGGWRGGGWGWRGPAFGALGVGVGLGLAGAYGGWGLGRPGMGQRPVCGLAASLDRLGLALGASERLLVIGFQ
jgi:hypothetical protein